MGAKIRDYRDLTVWQRAMELVVECYAAARQFPKSELYALSNQLQRAAVSVPSNIAEGNGRASLGDYLRHLSIANGSLMEVETQVRVARRLAYLTEAQEGPASRSEQRGGTNAGDTHCSPPIEKGRRSPRWSPVPGPWSLRMTENRPHLHYCFGKHSVLSWVLASVCIKIGHFFIRGSNGC